MKVSDILRIKGGTLFTVTPKETLLSALKLMADRDIGSLVVMEHGELVGMGRVVGDGGTIFYIQDVVVIPEHQGQGCGAMVMERIMNYIQTHAHNHSTVGLMAAFGKERFYEHYGFKCRPNEKLGAGMTIFWEKAP